MQKESKPITSIHIPSTLLLVFDEANKKVLLAMKKRGFGEGRWNGVGGKIQIGETALKAAFRETKEEIGLKVLDPEHIGTLVFIFEDVAPGELASTTVELFKATQWEGEPQETEEMRPHWFSYDKIPYQNMWPDDEFWLPPVLDGHKVKARFYFKNDGVLGQEVITKKIVEKY